MCARMPSAVVVYLALSVVYYYPNVKKLKPKTSLITSHSGLNAHPSCSPALPRIHSALSCSFISLHQKT